MLPRLLPVLFLSLVAITANSGEGVLAQDRLQPSDLHRKLVELLIAKPETSLTDAAEYANNLLPQYGLDYVLDAQFWIKAHAAEAAESTNLKASTDITLRADDWTFIGEIQGREYEGACLERWLEIPAVNITATTFEIVHNGERIAVERPEDVLVEHMKVLSANQQTVLAEVFIPDQNGPAGVSVDGKGVLLRYSLAESMRPWWDNVRRQHPGTVGQHPYLLLEVRADGIRFVWEPERYHLDDSKWITSFPTPPDNAFLRRWRFPASGYVVEFTGPCT